MALIGLFGGSFDPIHVGHLVMAECAVESLGLDRLYFVPSAQSPLKPGPPRASGKDRLAMIRAAIRGNPKFATLDLELKRPPPSYTIDTVAALGARASDKLFLLIGTDALLEFGRWHRARELSRKVTLAVLRRPGSDATRPPPWARRWKEVAAPLIDVSSSGLRDRIRRRRSIRYLVPDRVADLIRKRGLYP